MFSLFILTIGLMNWLVLILLVRAMLLFVIRASLLMCIVILMGMLCAGSIMQLSLLVVMLKTSQVMTGHK